MTACDTTSRWNAPRARLAARTQCESERVGIALAALVYYPMLIEARSVHGRARSLYVCSPLLDSRWHPVLNLETLRGVLVCSGSVAWLLVGVWRRSVCMAWVVFRGDDLRGSILLGGNLKVLNSHTGGDVSAVWGSDDKGPVLRSDKKPGGNSGGGCRRVRRPSRRGCLRSNRQRWLPSE